MCLCAVMFSSSAGLIFSVLMVGFTALCIFHILFQNLYLYHLLIFIWHISIYLSSMITDVATSN